MKTKIALATIAIGLSASCTTATEEAAKITGQMVCYSSAEATTSWGETERPEMSSHAMRFKVGDRVIAATMACHWRSEAAHEPADAIGHYTCFAPASPGIVAFGALASFTDHAAGLVLIDAETGDEIRTSLPCVIDRAPKG